jgi:lysozyme
MAFLSNDSKKKLLDNLVDDEGFRERPYRDSKGFLTIGFGFNLDVNGLPLSVALNWLDHTTFQIESQLSNSIPFWDKLNDARKSVLINMAYQMGIGGLLGFHGMLSKLGSKDYASACAEMKDSVWYREFTGRASRLIKIMSSGEF